MQKGIEFMENKKINLNNISKRLNEITDYLIDLKKETARVVIKQIAKTSISNVLEILNEEIKTAINVDITLIMYLITNEDIQVILEDDIPVLLNFTRTLYNMNTKFVDFPIERVANILLNLIDEINLEEMNFDELFEMMNDTLKKYIETKEDIQKFAEISE